MENRKDRKCLLCNNSNHFIKLITLDNMPGSAQDLPSEKELDKDFGETLVLEQCMDCGLVQFRCDPVSYYKDVIRAGGTTSTMRDLRVNQYKDFIERFKLEGKKIIEIGCGRGDFLHFLNDFNVKAVGLENKKESIEFAKNNWGGPLNVLQGFADENLGKVEGGPYDAFLSFNFLEHQPNPNSMLQAIYDNTTDNAVGLVTVPSLEYIINNNGYYELIKDHIAYYSFDTLKLLMNKNGFEVLSETIVNNDTLSIYVKKRQPLNSNNLNNNRKLLDESIKKLLSSSKKIAIWGASHQGFTLAATSKLNGKIEYIIDSAKFKQNKYSPATHIKIVPFEYFDEHPVDTILIIAPGYTNEIYQIIRTKNKEVKVYSLRSSSLEEMR